MKRLIVFGVAVAALAAMAAGKKPATFAENRAFALRAAMASQFIAGTFAVPALEDVVKSPTKGIDALQFDYYFRRATAATNLYVVAGRSSSDSIKAKLRDFRALVISDDEEIKAKTQKGLEAIKDAKRFERFTK